MTKKQHGIDMKKSADACDKWLKSSTSHNQSMLRSLKKAAESTNEHCEDIMKVFAIIVEIGSCAVIWQYRGASKLLRSLDEGWADFYQGGIYAITDLTLAKSYQKDGVLNHLDFLLSGLSAYVVGDDKAFVHSANLYESYPQFFYSFPRKKYIGTLAQFIRDGHLKKKPAPAPTASQGGPYADVIKHWGKDENQLAKAIATCCDYHLERRVCFNLPEGEEFNEPFFLIPIEIIALQKLAREQGIDFPEVKHPLLEVKLPPLPKKIPEIKDPTFQKIKKEFLYFNKDLRHKVKK